MQCWRAWIACAGWQKEGGTVFVFAPAISCLLSSLVLGCFGRGMWLSRAPSSPAHHGREIFAVLTLKCVNGALQGAVFTFVCRNDFFRVPGFSRWFCDQEFCSCFVVPPWSLWSSFGLCLARQPPVCSPLSSLASVIIPKSP